MYNGSVVTATNTKENFRDQLRRSGHKATPARLLVLSLLEKTTKPLSPQTIVEKVNGKTDQATIYRMLKQLKESGLIRQIDFHHSHPHYELISSKDHHHLICSRCGKSEDVPCRDMESYQATILRRSQHFNEIKEHALEFFGICKSCTRSNT